MKNASSRIKNVVTPGPSAPPFPQPVGGFAGRRAELERIAEHLDDEVLFVVYGVGGIGKSELVYQLIREVRSRPPWSEAVPLLVDVRPGATATRTLAQLLEAAGAAPEPRRGQPTEEAHLAEQLAALARLLDSRPYLLFIDDVHHLPADQVAEALRYLSRHTQRSRLIVASRRVIQLPPDAPPPFVTTLGPLDPGAAAQMMGALAERMQLPPPDRDQVMRATHGSPFHIRRMLVRHGAETDVLEDALAELPPVAMRVLAAAAVAQQRPSIDAMRGAWPGVGPLDRSLRELEQRFLIDIDHGRVMVHDLIREPLLDRLDPDELVSAHEDAAELCLEQLHDGARPSLIHVVDAIAHYIAAHRYAEAWDLVERWHSPLASAGSDHLLLEPLERLRLAMPTRRVAIDLLIVRCHVRASLIEDAATVLARVGEARTDAEEARHAALAGEIAQRRGDFATAEALFARAAEHAPDATTQFGAHVQTASVAMFGGAGTRARQILDDALAGLANPAPRQRARCAWTRTVSWMFDERFERAAAEARGARLELEDTGLDDLASRLAMLETLACMACGDMEHARAAARLIDESGLRQRVAALYRAILRYADGEAREASAELVAAHDYFGAHGDTMNAYLAGYYGSAALAEIGRLGDARALAERAGERARRAGLRGPAAQSLAQQALLSAEAVQTGAAHRLADEALSSEHIGPESRAAAHRAHARAHVIAGDITLTLHHLALARAAVASPGHAAATVAIDVEEAAAELIGGNLERAVELAERAIEHYRDRSRDFDTAHAQLVLAAAYLARGRRTDLIFAERTIAQARELSQRGGYRALQVGCAVLSAALARRGQRDRAADELLADALRELDPERGSLYAGALLAAIEGGAVARAMPGVVALLAHLGFTDAVDCYLVDQHGRRAATTADVEREKQLRALFVDESRSVITTGCGAVAINGRPMQCALLSVLVQARGEPVSPDTLYKRVWGANEYHPLQHRNALYVAINRLRKTLRDALPEREVIENATNGWRLARELDACVAIAARDGSR